MAYLDNILIYSLNLKEYKKYIQAILRKLQEAGIQINVNKWKFYIIETQYLGLIISINGKALWKK